jgi:hypothetical protein
MSNVLSYALGTFRRKPVRTFIEVNAVVANAAGVALGWPNEEQAFELPWRLFEQLPFADPHVSITSQ